MMYLKVLSKDNRACHGGAFDYTDYLPVGDEPGKPLPEREAVLCKSGWHWCTPESLMQSWAKVHMHVWEAEPSEGATAPDSDGKSVSSSGRLVRPYVLPEWWTDTMRFIDEEIPAVSWFQQVTEPDPAWRIFEAGTLAAARDAAGDAAWYAAWYAAGAAARDAARDAAGDAAGDAAWYAAWDAGLMARMLVCADLHIEQRHRDHVAARWDVWTRGYGLAADVDGVLYVYGVTGMKGDLSVGPDVARP